MVPMIGVAAWLTHRSADKKRAEIQPKIELTKSETARLDQIVRVMSAECHRIESLTLRTNELAGALKKTLQELQGNVQSLKTTGVALVEAMNAPGFDFSQVEGS
jgi:K+/H+ antiporter YhaU regulatory subunit KhtT